VIVAGMLRVIVHPACVVGGQFVPVWTEVRVTGQREPALEPDNDLDP
jgi:hypothetical protein